MTAERLNIPSVSTSRSQPPYAYERTRQFLTIRIGQGAFLIPEDERETRGGDRLAVANNILGFYYYRRSSSCSWNNSKTGTQRA